MQGFILQFTQAVVTAAVAAANWQHSCTQACWQNAAVVIEGMSCCRCIPTGALCHGAELVF
jgi:hypothetical protein